MRITFVIYSREEDNYLKNKHSFWLNVTNEMELSLCQGLKHGSDYHLKYKLISNMFELLDCSYFLVISTLWNWTRPVAIRHAARSIRWAVRSVFDETWTALDAQIVARVVVELQGCYQTIGWITRVRTLWFACEGESKTFMILHQDNILYISKYILKQSTTI